MTTDNYNHPDDDDCYDDDDDMPDGPDYWGCNCCGHTQVREPGWGQCPKCTALMEPQYY